MQHRVIVTWLTLVSAACVRPDPAGVPADASQVTLPGQQNENLADAIGPYRYHSDYTGRERLVIRSAADWNSAWDKIVGSVAPKPPIPAIDFTTHMVLLAAMGTRNSGGYTIEVPAVFESQSQLYARVLETSPGGMCGVTGALTAPVAAVIVPAFSGQVRFIEETAVRTC